MITFENKLLVTNNINLALIQYGHIILIDMMKNYLYPFSGSNNINEELEGIWEDLIANGSNAIDSIDKLYKYSEVTFNQFNSGKKTALYYLYLNNSDYLDNIIERIELDSDTEGDDFEEILGRAIAEEIYYAENKNELYKGLISFLTNHLTNLISNLNQIDEEMDFDGAMGVNLT